MSKVSTAESQGYLPVSLTISSGFESAVEGATGQEGQTLTVETCLNLQAFAESPVQSLFAAVTGPSLFEERCSESQQDDSRSSFNNGSFVVCNETGSFVDPDWLDSQQTVD